MSGAGEREEGAAGLVGAGPRPAESARALPSKTEERGRVGAGLREPTRAARWARSGAAGRAGGGSCRGGRGRGSRSGSGEGGGEGGGGGRVAGVPGPAAAAAAAAAAG